MTRVNMLALLLLVVINVDGDVYMHNPPGSNNRLNGQNRNRRNNNRLFDSQNNNRGGYNVGGTGQVEGAASLTYVGGSELNIEWTNQHECGGKNTGCDIILQYMCIDGLRDGRNTGTPQENNDNNKASGRHESQDHYADCKARLRDENLYHADQNMQNRFAAKHTRQNNNGKRSGLECPEERDYYPNHHPTPWKDIAILTNNVDRCNIYKSQSQNVLAKSYCKFPNKAARNRAKNDNRREKKAPITQAACVAMGGGMTWETVPSHGLAAPECLPAPVSRDNQLGNTVSEGPAKLGGCAEVGIGMSGHGVAGEGAKGIIVKSWKECSDECRKFTKCKFWSYTLPPTNHCGLQTSDKGRTIQSNRISGTRECGLTGPTGTGKGPTGTGPTGTGKGKEPTGADKIPKTLSYKWKIPDIDDEACVLRIRYNITVGDYKPFAVSAENDKPKSSVCKPTLDIGTEYGLRPNDAKKRGYEMKNDPKIKPMANFPKLDFQLALNTAQTGRTFQDRSHKFRITKLKNVPNIPASVAIHNLNVMGKRGNIVQVYPAVEYGFEPAILKVKKGDFIHAQWTGSLRNPRNNDGEGRKGEDKSNMIIMTERTYKKNEEPAKNNGHPANSYPLKINKQRFLGVNSAVANQLAFPKKENNVLLPVGSVAVFVINADASSVYQNRLNLWGPKLAFTGRSARSTGYFHSALQNNPWVRVEIEPTALSSITLINRKDCCGNRLRMVEIRAGTSSNPTGNQVVGTFRGPGITKGEYIIPFTGKVTARYVTIQIKGNNQILQINGIKFNEADAKFQRLGCFRDRRQRAISGGNQNFAYANVIQKCANKAKKAGNKIFAVQNNVECFTDGVANEANAAQTYARYGATTGCRNGRGGGWRQDVYKTVPGTAVGVAALTAAGGAAPAADPCQGKRENAYCARNYGPSKNYYCKLRWLKNNCCRFCLGSTSGDEPMKSDEKVMPVPKLPDNVQIAIPIPEDLKDLPIDDEKMLIETIKDVESQLEESGKKIGDILDVYDDEVFEEKEKRGGRGDAAKLDNAPPYVNLAPIKADTCETYNYVCTRNNNFSNRSQKGKIIVEGC